MEDKDITFSVQTVHAVSSGYKIFIESISFWNLLEYSIFIGKLYILYPDFQKHVGLRLLDFWTFYQRILDEFIYWIES